MGTQSKLKKNMLRLILISIAGTMIYGLPYFRSYYYDAYLQTYGLTNSQMGMFGSIFGIMGACSYLFGGVVADMFSARKLMTISMISPVWVDCCTCSTRATSCWWEFTSFGDSPLCLHSGRHC